MPGWVSQWNMQLDPGVVSSSPKLGADYLKIKKIFKKNTYEEHIRLSLHGRLIKTFLTIKKTRTVIHIPL